MKINFFKHSINDFSIKHQLRLITLPILVSSVLIIGGYLVYDSTRQLNVNYHSLATQDAQHTRSIIHDTCSNFKKYADALTNDSQLRSLLEENYSDNESATQAIDNYQYLNNVYKQDTAIKSILVYSDNTSLPNYQHFISMTHDDMAKEAWYEKASEQWSAFWLTIPDDDDDFQYLTIYQRVPMPLSDNMAVLEIKMDYNYLKNRINNSNYLNQMFLNQDTIFYSDKFSEVSTKAISINESVSTKVAANYVHNTNNKTTLLAYTALPLSNGANSDTVYIYSFDTDAFSAILENGLRWSGILIFILSISIILTLYFSRFFSSRIQKLQETVYRASIEDYSFFNEIAGHDEISTISLNFHKIINHIKKKEEEIYQSKITEQELLNQQQKMAFSILASQINPHFLFNTLETIRMTALQHKDRDVANAISLLSKSMRYTLSNQGKRITSLQEELDAIQVYTQIQQLRFGERVHYNCIIDPELNPKEIYLLPLLIQPLIENAISHGLESVAQNGFVTLAISLQEPNTLCISVSDNGVGIEPAKLARIQEDISKNDIEDTSHIGLKNVHNRIKQYYGDQYGLFISSIKGQGTMIKLLFPLQRQVDDDN